MPDQLYTKDFWLKTFALCFHVAAGAAVGVLTSEGISTLKDVPWQGLTSSAVVAALYAFLASIAGPTKDAARQAMVDDDDDDDDDAKHRKVKRRKRTQGI